MIEGTILSETAAAICFRPEGATEAQQSWVPRSIISYLWRESNSSHTKAKITLPRWKVDKLKWRDFDDE